MRNLSPIVTVHATNPAGEITGFVYPRPMGGYISMIEIKVKESGFITTYHPELPALHDTRTQAHDAVADKVLEFDWELDHPWLSRHARSNAFTTEDPDHFDAVVEDLVTRGGYIPTPDVQYMDVECMAI